MTQAQSPREAWTSYKTFLSHIHSYLSTAAVTWWLGSEFTTWGVLDHDNVKRVRLAPAARLPAMPSSCDPTSPSRQPCSERPFRQNPESIRGNLIIMIFFKGLHLIHVLQCWNNSWNLSTLISENQKFTTRSVIGKGLIRHNCTVKAQGGLPGLPMQLPVIMPHFFSPHPYPQE